MSDIKITSIKRLIAHKVFSGESEDGKSLVFETSLFLKNNEVEKIIIEKLNKSFSENNKFFKLRFANFEANSFYSLALKIKDSKDDGFIKLSQDIATLLSVAQKTLSIPSGLLIVLEAKLDNGLGCIITIKAELHDTFTINQSNKVKKIDLIKDTFLAPSNKDFYKIGLFIENSKHKVKYDSYVYDNHFTPQKNDLAEYFYKAFLGLETADNSQLRNLQYYHDGKKFFEKNVTSEEEQIEMILAFRASVRTNAKGIIDPTDFMETHIVDDTLKKKFELEVIKKYPKPFIQDLQLLNKKFKKDTLNILAGIKLVFDNEMKDYFDVFNSKQDFLSFSAETKEQIVKIIAVRKIT